MFFLIGIAVALIAVLYVIQIESAVPLKPQEPKPETGEIVDIQIPVTEAPEPEKKERTVKEPQQPRIFKGFFEVSNDTMPPSKKPWEPPSPGADDTPKKVEAPIEMDVETHHFAVIEKVAVPMECAGLVGNEERKACLNKWMQVFIAKNTQYPELSRAWGEQEKVYVSFLIDEFGAVQEVKVVRGEYNLLKQEAKRVLNNLPKFDPPTQRGRKARMRMIVPVNFRLE